MSEPLRGVPVRPAARGEPRRFRRATLPVLLTVAALGRSPEVAALDKTKALTQFGLDTWQARQGLPQSSVSAILQSRDGYLWVGTQEGLARFDGARFTVFDKRNSPEFKTHNITAIAEDSTGSLWAGTGTSGLIQLRGGRLKRFTTQDGLAEDKVMCLLAEEGGALLVGHFTKGISRGRDGRFEPVAAAALGNIPVRALARTPDDALWVGTRGKGLFRVAGETVTQLTTKEGLLDDILGALAVGPDGALWIGTASGLMRLQDGLFKSWTAKDGLPDPAVRTLRFDRDGCLWIGTTSGGLTRFEGGRFRSLSPREGLANPTVLSLAEDREGSLWIGTGGGGLQRLRHGKFLAYGVPEGLPSDLIQPVLGSKDGGLWVGTLGAGVAHLSLPDGAVTTYSTREGLLSDRVWALCETRDGSLWIGTRGGLNQLKNGRLKGYTTKEGLPNPLVTALAEGASGELWVGTADGLCLFREGSCQVYGVNEGLTNTRVLSLISDGMGGIYIGTFGGGLFHLKDGRFSNISTKDGLSNDWPTALYLDSKGVLWIGTQDGVNRLENGRLTLYGRAQGLFDDVAYTFQEDTLGRFWMTSNRGVFFASKAAMDAYAEGTLTSVLSTSLGEKDGMRESECNGAAQPASARTPDGRLWFPTGRGLVGIDPKHIPQNSVVPPVVIESLAIDGKEMPVGAPVKLAPGQDRLEIRYTALSLLAPEHVRFRYRLEGLDSNWTDAGTRRVAYYTNLKPGRYVFRVLACNDDGLWNETGAALAVELTPRFTQTPWFLGLVTLLIAAVVIGLHRARVASVRLHGQLAAARLQTLKTQFQPHFLFNSLNQVLPLIYRDPRTAEQMIVDLGELLRLSLTREADELIPLADELEFVQKYLRLQLARFHERLSVAVHVDGDARRAAIPNLLLQPLCENAIKHGISTRAGKGRIEVSVKKEADTLILRVWNSVPSGEFATLQTPDISSRTKSGVGLKNLRGRLDFVYGRRYSLATSQRSHGGSDEFEAVLRLPYTPHAEPESSAVGAPVTSTADAIGR